MNEEIQNRPSRLRTVITGLTVIVLLVLIYSLRKQIGSVVEELGRVNTWALLLIIPIEVWNYDAYARYLRRVFGMLGEKVSYWPMYKFTLELNFVNHILPSGGLSGISFFNLRAKSLGISGAKSALTQFTKLFLLYASFQPLLVLGVFLLALRGHTNNFIILIASSLITSLIIGTMVALYILESRRRINRTMTNLTKALNAFLHFFRPKHPETINIVRAQKTFDELHESYVTLKSKWRELKVPFIYMMIANATEVAALYVVYIAFGEFVNVGAVILAYAVANFAGLISVLPSGIGVYEGLMTGVLVATGIPAELSIPVTIMYRVVNMFIQLTPGYFLYQQAVKRGVTKKV